MQEFQAQPCEAARTCETEAELRLARTPGQLPIRRSTTAVWRVAVTYDCAVERRCMPCSAHRKPPKDRRPWALICLEYALAVDTGLSRTCFALLLRPLVLREHQGSTPPHRHVAALPHVSTPALSVFPQLYSSAKARAAPREQSGLLRCIHACSPSRSPPHLTCQSLPCCADARTCRLAQTTVRPCSFTAPGGHRTR